ncbi:ATP-binding protein [Spirulina sp. CS-785/01]|uniref:ATP-binding protein n=1 Tax=Spirulina sp. CS-785/01 TaxID=3021716 RepID=UPI00232EE627|nr:ATP-binding protein [Spirulina sp. CS-785/01]MDB9314785.1 ATP-binding protein [Spirulina sp. CS-785/01]
MISTSGQHLHYPPLSDSLTLWADSDKLKQVLINLISNASEAVESVESEQQQVVFSVINGGSPIPANLLPKLMQPFLTTKSTGNGLGLAIVKQIVQAHNGTFTLESQAISSGETGSLPKTIAQVRLPTLEMR